MNTQFKDVINQKTEAIITDSFHVDEERQLIAMTPEGIKSIINTVISAAADCAIDDQTRNEILKLGIV